MEMSTTKARPQVTVPNTLPLLVYTQDEFHADPNIILSTVPASESSVSESAHPSSYLGLLVMSSS